MDKQIVIDFYENICENSDHRYKSWEHCYEHFLDLKENGLSEEDEKLAQLHLGFYLASWGMYRGSSFILQKDYTIYSDIVEMILDPKYDLLWDIDKHRDKIEELNELFIDLYTKIEEKLSSIKKSIKNHDDLQDESFDYETISDTLITKILLGTVGCIPAYDRIFKDGLSSNKNIQKYFNPEKSFKQVLSFYNQHRQQIKKAQEKIKKHYTPMKIIDMYFWKLGTLENTN